MTVTSTLLTIVGLATVALVALAARRRSTTAEPLARACLGDIPRLYQLVAQTHQDGAFAVLLFGERSPSPGTDSLNVQFSVENGRAGLDWVLLAPPNVAARERVAEFFAQRGSPLSLRTMNEVSYLRTEQGDLAALCRDLLTTVFGVTPAQQMPLIAEGFTWNGT